MDNKNFLEQVILKVDPDLDDVGIEMLVSDAEPVLQERLFTKIISILNEDQRIKLVSITNENQWINWKVYEYLVSQISNYEDFMEKTYQEFEDMYLREYKNFSKSK